MECSIGWARPDVHGNLCATVLSLGAGSMRGSLRLDAQLGNHNAHCCDEHGDENPSYGERRKPLPRMVRLLLRCHAFPCGK